MFKLVGLWRGLMLTFVFVLAISIIAAGVMEVNSIYLDSYWGTESFKLEQVSVTCPKCGEQTMSSICDHVTGKDAETGEDVICGQFIPEIEWTYEQEWTTAEEMYEGLKEIAIRQAEESVVLLKNELEGAQRALPISPTAKLTLLGARSFAPQYGGTAASVTDGVSTEGNEIFDAFATQGFQINPSMLAAYKAAFRPNRLNEDGTAGDGVGGYGWNAGRGYSPHWGTMSVLNNVVEISPAELRELKSDYDSEFGTYNDAAIVVLGRQAQEGGTGYRPGLKGIVPNTADPSASNNWGIARGITGTETNNVLGITNEEREILDLAKAKFNKVIVLINTANMMEIESLKKDPQIDAIAWVGLPGSYGFHGVARVLNGKVAPSGHLGDLYAVNTFVNPAMMNYGGDNLAEGNLAGAAGPDGTAWKVDADYAKNLGQGMYGSGYEYTNANNNIHNYLVQAEGIYTGYRYYETRYADTVMNKGNAKTAKAGTWTAADYKPATVDGTWSYNNEVSYGFGAGMSYTSFKQTLDDVFVSSDKKRAEVRITVQNTGSVAGKSVVQLYAQSPYAKYDVTNANNVEKSAIQLIDYEKTVTLDPNESTTVIMEVDMQTLASYDYKKAKTYILDPGDYYFSIGNGAHDALNNVLAAQGYTTANGMTDEGDESKTYKWTWTGEVDSKTFGVSKAGVDVTNQLSGDDDAEDKIYAMDWNAFVPGTVKYLSRNDWNGSYPKTYSDLSPDDIQDAALREKVEKVFINDFIPIKTDEDVSDIIFNDTSSDLEFADMKGVAFDDPLWDELLNKMDVQEFLNFAAQSFHNVLNQDSVGLPQFFADDGPIGSDSRYIKDGQYKRVPFVDAEKYEGTGHSSSATANHYGSRVHPSPMNLAYSWNKELAYEVGQKALGEVFMSINAPLNVGPGANIHRHAYNSRMHEYYSEDPILSGFTGSSITAGAQSKGCVVNIKHFAFNDQEIKRDGVAPLMHEQKARELELRNFQQIFEGNGKPASFKGTENRWSGALGTMLSYSRIGLVACGANKAAMVDILREEWGFVGYAVTDFSSVALKAAPKEAVMHGTTAFCGSRVNANITNHPGYQPVGVDKGEGWTAAAFRREDGKGGYVGDRDYLLAFKRANHYNLYALANSNAINGPALRRVYNMTWWRQMYITLISVSSVLTVAAAAVFVISKIKTGGAV